MEKIDAIYIGTDLEEYSKVKLLLNTFGIMVEILSTMSGIYQMIEKHRISLILFELDIFKDVPDDTDVCEITNMISTLYKFSKHPGDLTQAVIVKESSDLGIIKSLHSTIIKGFVPASLWLGIQETEYYLKELMAGRRHSHKNILEKSNKTPKKVRNSKETIHLTERQKQISRIICNRGISNKAIAKLLNISESTVKLHISAVFKKFGIRNRTQLALCANDILGKMSE